MRAKRYGIGTGKTVRDQSGKTVRVPHGQNCTWPVGAKRYGTGRGKTARGPYGLNGTGPVRAKRYGAHTGYGAGAVRDTVWARYVARTFPRVQPVRATYRAHLGARTNIPVVGTAPTMPVRACLLGLFRLIVSSGALFITWTANRTIKYTHHLQNQKNWHLDKTRTIFSIVKPGTQTRHTYTFKIKGSRCYYYHQHHCHNHQLTAVSFVGTVATVVSAIAHIILVDTLVVLALPGRFGANVLGWATKKLSAFIVTCIHIHRHSIGLSSFSYSCVFAVFVFLTISSIFVIIASHHFQYGYLRLLTLRFSFIHLYRQLHATLSSHSITSIGTPRINISLPLIIISSFNFYCHLHSSY